MSASSQTLRRIQRAGFVLLSILTSVGRQIRDDSHAGILAARALYREWVATKWPRVPTPIRRAMFGVGVSARAVYRAGHYGGRTIAIGIYNGLEEGHHRHREHHELREYLPGSAGHIHATQRIAQDRRERADGYRMCAEQVHGAATQHRAERAVWARAATLTDLGEVTAQWIEGKVRYNPAYGDLNEETQEISGQLAALNRHGFVTSGSQPGRWEPNGWGGYNHQRAAVDGFTDPVTAHRIEAAAAAAGLICIRNGPAQRRTHWRHAVPVTASPLDSQPITDGSDYHTHTVFGAHLSRRQVRFDFDGHGAKALTDAEQVTVIDPQWGRQDLLWDTLTGALTATPPPDPSPPTRAAGGSGPAREPRPARGSQPAPSNNGVPPWPGEPTEVGVWRVTHVDGDGVTHTTTGITQQHAEALAAWRQWRATTMPGFGDPNNVTVEQIPRQPTPHTNNTRTSQSNNNNHPTNSTNGHPTNGGNGMTSIEFPAWGQGQAIEVTSTPALRLVYEKTKPAMLTIQEQLKKLANDLHSDSAQYDHAIGFMTADEFKDSSIPNAVAVQEAMRALAEAVASAVAATDPLIGGIDKAHSDSVAEHTLLEEAVSSAPGGGPAKSTDSYQAR